MSDDGARGDHRVLANVHRKNGGIRPNGSAAADFGAQELFRIVFASGKAIVGKGGVRADEDVVANPDAVPELNSALDGAPIADHDVVFDETVVADIAVSPDLRSGKDVRERPNPCALLDGLTFDDCLLRLKKLRSSIGSQI